VGVTSCGQRRRNTFSTYFSRRTDVGARAFGRSVMGVSRLRTAPSLGERFLACHCCRIRRSLFGSPAVRRPRSCTVLVGDSFADVGSLSPPHRSVLVEPPTPEPADGIVRWLALVIADHFPAWCLPDVADADPTGVSTLLQLGSVLIALELILLSWLTLTLVLPQQPPLDDHTKMNDIEMAFEPSTGPNSDPHRKGSEDDGRASLMDIDAEKENAQASIEICGGLIAAGLPFPGEILADGTFAVEYHDMCVYSFLYFKATYSTSLKTPSDGKKIRRQQLIDLCARFKLTRSGNMSSLRVSLRNFSSDRDLWDR
jgi:hypothetical protein